MKTQHASNHSLKCITSGIKVVHNMVSLQTSIYIFILDTLSDGTEKKPFIDPISELQKMIAQLS